jgi:hypothetical protein
LQRPIVEEKKRLQGHTVEVKYGLQHHNAELKKEIAVPYSRVKK